MVLIDTSVLIPYFKGIKTVETEKLNALIEQQTPYGICNFVYQELLQGVRTIQQFQLLKEYLDTQRSYELRNGRESYASAAKLFFNCQKAGVTIRKGVDLLIAQIAIENNLQLLHNDKDFMRLSGIEKRLRIY